MITWLITLVSSFLRTQKRSMLMYRYGIRGSVSWRILTQVARSWLEDETSIPKSSLAKSATGIHSLPCWNQSSCLSQSVPSSSEIVSWRLPELMWSWLPDIGLDPWFKNFYFWCKENDIPVVIVSRYVSWFPHVIRIQTESKLTSQWNDANDPSCLIQSSPSRRRKLNRYHRQRGPLYWCREERWWMGDRIPTPRESLWTWQVQGYLALQGLRRGSTNSLLLWWWCFWFVHSFSLWAK